ncbi:MAG: hypothetical protein WC663_06060 [Patescibacteria group bacterium]|jgi:glutathione synthase/RimK-type ligase-like ATP-grasp enzyme
MKNLQKILVIYQGDDWDKEIPFDKEANRKGYEAWAEQAGKMEVEMVRASIEWFDKKNGSFKKYWQFKNGKWEKNEKSFLPDVVLNKIKIREKMEDLENMKAMQKSIPIINDPIFSSLFDNKINQCLLFSEFMPESFFAGNFQNLERILKSMDQEKKIVLKPIDQSGGFGIIIEKIKNIDLKKVSFPVLGQEFLEADASFWGFKDRVADLRMVFVGEELSYAATRVAPEGSLFTNFHQGAVLNIIDEKKIPEEIWNIVKKVNKRISFFSERIYSLDFLYDKKNGPKLIEMNTKPGVDYFNENNFDTREKYFTDVLEAMDSWLM